MMGDTTAASENVERVGRSEFERHDRSSWRVKLGFHFPNPLTPPMASKNGDRC